MRLGEALQVNSRSAGEVKRTVHVLCGFMPLHLETFVKARVCTRFPLEGVLVQTGLFDDLEGNVKRAREKPADGAIIVIEWSDLDRRLGYRASAGWRGDALSNMAEQIAEVCRRLQIDLAVLAKQMPVVVVPPTLELPPVTHQPSRQTDQFELDVNATVSRFLQQIASDGVRILSTSSLLIQSAPVSRHDLKMELLAGFPYTVAHADAVADLAVRCLFRTTPKKGLITDLDQTLWKGILGDSGVDGVSWSLEGKSQGHALYQQLLASLAESGVLIGIASKNDPEPVAAALARADILIGHKQIFPIHANWNAKSASVGLILKTWNVGAESVVFVDDSPLEVAEVKEQHPEMECLLFPAGDPAAILTLIRQLRDCFGKTEVRAEDRLRLNSIRNAAELESHQAAGNSDDFLSRLQAKITLENSGADPRAFELVNKTNQFNLNGVRFTEGDWKSRATRQAAFCFSVSYQDRFGPLGRIAVIAGWKEGTRYIIDTWVMSCRAFSRQIEYQTLQQLFTTLQVDELQFQYAPTARNGPTQTFFATYFSEGELQQGELVLSSLQFNRNCPVLFHQVNNQWTK